VSKRNRNLDQLEDTPVSKRRAAAGCCWPGCPKSRLDEVPICAAHLSIAREVWVDRNSTQEARSYRVTATIAEPEAPEPAEQKMGVVYYLRSGGYIKIGWASNLANRMKAYPPDSMLLAHHPGTRADEATMHRKFAVHRTHGREWYAMVPALTDHIRRIASSHGIPDPVTFAAQPVTVPQPRPRQYVGGNYRGNGRIGEARGFVTRP